jgi:hypothetical protein
MSVDNRSFWNIRYVTLPQLGSGQGSRGYAAAFKNALIHATIQSEEIHSIFDIGCGDLCWLDDRILKSCNYVGFDISEVVVEKNIASHPTTRFEHCDITATSIGAIADLVVSFDVLIHQIERPKFLVALMNILAAVGKVGLLSYMTPPLPDGSCPTPASLDRTSASPDVIALEDQLFKMLNEELPPDRPAMATTFHGPLPDIIRSLRHDMVVREVGRYRHHTVYEVRPLAARIHPTLV